MELSINKSLYKSKKAIKRTLTGVFGKILIVPLFIGYYLTHNVFLQLLILDVLFICIRVNYYGITFCKLKSKGHMKKILY